MKKLTFSIVVAVFYVIYIVYDRSHASVLSLATAPPTQNMLSLQQSVGSVNPPLAATGLPASPANNPRGSTSAQQTAASNIASQIVSAAPTQNSAPQPTPTPVQVPTPTPVLTPTPAPQPQGQYKDGQYTGSSADAFYGFVQVKAIISGGKIVDVQFLSYPSDRQNSVQINSQAMPYLTQEAIAAQSANVNIVSGATDTSQAFIQSLSAALAQAI